MPYTADAGVCRPIASRGPRRTGILMGFTGWEALLGALTRLFVRECEA